MYSCKRTCSSFSEVSEFTKDSVYSFLEVKYTKDSVYFYLFRHPESGSGSSSCVLLDGSFSLFGCTRKLPGKRLGGGRDESHEKRLISVRTDWRTRERAGLLILR